MLDISSLKTRSPDIEENISRLNKALNKLELKIAKKSLNSSSPLEEENKALKSELAKLKEQFNFVNKSITKITSEVSSYIEEVKEIKSIYGSNNNKNK